MKLFLLNSVCGTGSTGHICVDLAREYEWNGYDAKALLTTAAVRSANATTGSPLMAGIYIIPTCFRSMAEKEYHMLLRFFNPRG
ncbi:MAG: hypothetical protein K5673_04590 [Lachnospiraceae bacterium]|nr:hypothetical protein [Lachnospiraceae bacterium]